ncbi:MAG: Ser-Thr-rich GPI-anchored membrane family protein [Methanomicrobiales archaeon]
MSPNGGETWKRGTDQTISWNYTGSPVSTVTIILLKGGIEVGTITDSTSLGSGGTGSYTWSMSSTGMTGNDFKVSIRDTEQSSINGVSNGYFTITS